MSDMQLKESNVKEVMHLLDVMEKYEVVYAFELYTEDGGEPLISMSRGVSVDYLLAEERNKLRVFLGNTCLEIDLASCTFSKKVWSCCRQIEICISSDKYEAWLNWIAFPRGAMEEATNRAQGTQANTPT